MSVYPDHRATKQIDDLWVYSINLVVKIMMDEDDRDGNWLGMHQLQLTGTILTHHLASEPKASYVKSINSVVKGCITRLCDLKLPTDYYNVYNTPALYRAIGRSDHNVEWERSAGPLASLSQRIHHTNGLANDLRRQRDEVERDLDSLQRQSRAARKHNEDQSTLHAEINTKRSELCSLDRDLVSVVSRPVTDTLDFNMDTTNSTKDGTFYGSYRGNPEWHNSGSRDVLKVVPGELVEARIALNALCAVSDAARRGCLVAMVATARQHTSVFEALRQALSTATVLGDGSVLQDERLHSSERKGRVPDYLHSETPDDSSCVMMDFGLVYRAAFDKEFGLVDRAAFDAWFEKYSNFLDFFDKYHGWRDGNHKYQDRQCIRFFYEQYTIGIYEMLVALVDRRMTPAQSNHADLELGRKMDSGVQRILDANQRCLHERLNFAIPADHMSFWATRLEPDLLKKAVGLLAQYDWQSAPKPATHPPPDGLLRAATLCRAIANMLVGCSGTDSVVKLLEAHVAVCSEGDDRGRAPSGYLRLTQAKQLLGVLRSGHWMPSKKWLCKVAEKTITGFFRDHPREQELGRLLYAIPELGVYTDMRASSDGVALLAEIQKIPSLLWKSVSLDALGLKGGALGLKWKCIGPNLPVPRKSTSDPEKKRVLIELVHSGLAAALPHKREFTQAEWDTFGGSERITAMHYVKVGDLHYVPDGSSKFTNYTKSAPLWQASPGKRKELGKLSKEKVDLEKKIVKRTREERGQSVASMAEFLRNQATSDPNGQVYGPRNRPLADGQNLDDGAVVVFLGGLHKSRKRQIDVSNGAPDAKKRKMAPLRQLCEPCAAIGVAIQATQKASNDHVLLCKLHNKRYGNLALPKSDEKKAEEATRQTADQQQEHDIGADEVNEVGEVGEMGEMGEMGEVGEMGEMGEVGEMGLVGEVGDTTQQVAGPSTIGKDPTSRINEIKQTSTYAAAANRAAHSQRPVFQPEVYMAYRICLIHAAAVSSDLPSSLMGLLIARLKPLELPIPGHFFELPPKSDVLGIELARDHVRTLPTRFGGRQAVHIEESLYRHAMELAPVPDLKSGDRDTVVTLQPSGGFVDGVAKIITGARLSEAPTFTLSILPTASMMSQPYRISLATADGQELKKPFNDDPRAGDICVHPYSTRSATNAIKGITSATGTVLELKLSHHVTTLGTRLRFRVELGDARVSLKLKLKCFDHGSVRYFERAEASLSCGWLYSQEFEVSTKSAIHPKTKLTG